MKVVLERELLELNAPLIEPPVDTLRLAIRHRRLLAGVTFAAAVVAALMSLLLPSTYVSTVRLLPPQQTQSTAASFLGPSVASPLAAIAQKELGLKNPTDLYIGLLNSSSIHDALIERFRLAEVYRVKRLSQVREKLIACTRIQVTKEGLITVSVEDRDAIRSAELGNAYAEALGSLTKRLAVSEAGQRRAFYEEQVRQAKDDLERAESALRAVQQRTGVLQVDTQTKALIESATALRSQIASGEVQLHALRNIGTDENPDVRQAQARLQGWRHELELLESQPTADPAFSKAQARAQAQEYLRAMRDVLYQRTVLDVLLRQSEAAKIDEARETTLIQVVDSAAPPDTRASPRPVPIVLFAALVAFFFMICALRLRQRFYLSPAWQRRLADLRAEWRP